MNQDELLRQIQELEAENSTLRTENQALKHAESTTLAREIDSLTLDEYKRYGRQMIVPEFGSYKGQMKLKQASILVIGAGGLGCPTLLYLAAAGIGKIGILDNDTVDTSNLHRQVLHTTSTVGMLKCESARRYIVDLNPHVEVETHPVRLSYQNAFSIVSRYDLLVDCTDTPATRYLINDVAVVCGKTVVSGSGVKTEGQITVLNFQNKGPCYRCFYPKPPKPESVSTCSDSGVLGPAIGLTGVALAMETIKVLSGYYDQSFQPFLAMYSAYPQQSMRVFKMRGRQAVCAVCGDSPTVSKATIESKETNYEIFCGKPDLYYLGSEHRVSPKELQEALQNDTLVFLLDVRPKEQFEIVSLPNSHNINWYDMARMDSVDSMLPLGFNKASDSVFLICRYGNDSQLAARKLIDLGFKHVKDVRGGLRKWSSDVDPTFPVY